jgi:hypothetical protein
MCQDVGVIPQQYLADNGSSFSSRGFTTHLQEFKQIISFAGVGAHHHNGIAERSIQTIMSIARTMMLHSAIHWPDVADPVLWPMAVKHAIFLHNHVPDASTGLSPADLFTRSRWPHAKFHDLHVWGCPVYVLEKAMQDGKKLPRWKPRSTRRMNMGLSSAHASTVPLVLNPTTGSITPQFHVVFDDWFATVSSTVDMYDDEAPVLPPFDSPEWEQLFGETEYQYVFDHDDNDIDDDAMPSDLAPPPVVLQRQSDVITAMDRLDPAVPFPEPLPVNGSRLSPLPAYCWQIHSKNE